MDIFVQTNNLPNEIEKFASRLGGICQNEAFDDFGCEQHYRFSLASNADQFELGIRHYPEVMKVARKPNLIEQAIANSRLCACGSKTVLDCATECDRNG